MAAPYDLITFDCYGTLIDWEAGMRATLRRLGRELGVAVDADRMVRRYAQVELGLEQGRYAPYRDVLTEGLSAVFKEQGVTLGARRSAAFARTLKDWKPFSETRTVLRRLRREGYRTAILSNIDDGLLRASLKRLAVPFDHIVTAESVRSYKPSPKHWLRILDVSGVPKRRILHVGASVVHDVIPARTLGFSCVWINRKAENRTPLLSADRVFADLRKLPDWLSRQ